MTRTQEPTLLDPPASAAKRRKLFINNEWVDAASGKTFDAIAPSTGKVITQIAEGDAADIDRAVAAARAAFDGPWAKFTPTQRERVMHQFADKVEERWDELVATDSYDMGFPIGFGSVVAGGYGPHDILRYFAGWPSKIKGETLPNSAGEDLFSYTRREPIGVVGAITPWNAPRMGVVKMAPVLASGCTMVIKPSEVACLSSLIYEEIISELDLPPGVINIVPGGGRTAGAALAEHPGVNKLTFTGSTATGQSLVRASAGNLKRVTLELGGKSPDIIFADADLDAAILTAGMGVFGNSGQMCTAGSRIFVERSVYDEFVARVAELGKMLKVGNSLDPTTTIGPIVSQRQLDRVSSYLEAGVDAGAEIVTGGSRISDGDLAGGYFIPPTVFAGVTDDMKIAREEIFGPVATSYGLVGGVWTRDIRKATAVSHALECGVVWVNTYNTFDPGVPFGGHKMSGWGSELSHHGLEGYLKVKAVWLNYA